MKVKIEYKDQQKNGKEDLLQMKQFIERKNITGLKKVEISTLRPKKGEMGPGIGTTLVGLLGAATNPLTTLCSAIVEWVHLHRSDVKLRLDNGEELVISANLRRSQKAINQIVETFVNKALELRQKSPATEKKQAPCPPPPLPAPPPPAHKPEETRQ